MLATHVWISKAHTWCLIALGVSLLAGIGRDRRVVDTVHVGDAVSEASHGYAASDVVMHTINGRSYRSARGWMRYALTTFDDTEVTLTCTFAPNDRASAERYDILVEDSVIATRPLRASASDVTATPVVVEVAVPFGLTKGRTNIAVTIRARGGPTPLLGELRVIQDHNEVDQFAVMRSGLSIHAVR